MSAYSDLIISDGPVSYWRLDETGGTNAIDQMGAHNLNYQGTYTLNQT